MDVQESVLSGLEPPSFWAPLTRIGRPSRHEESVIEHVRAWGAERGLEVKQDAGKNLVDDLAETSTSPGEAITEGDRLTLHSLSRSRRRPRRRSRR